MSFKTIINLLVTEISKSSLSTVLPLLVASQVYWPLLDGEVSLRGVRERVLESDVSSVCILFLNHLYADVVTPIAPPLTVQVSVYCSPASWTPLPVTVTVTPVHETKKICKYTVYTHIPWPCVEQQVHPIISAARHTLSLKAVDISEGTCQLALRTKYSYILIASSN